MRTIPSTSNPYIEPTVIVRCRPDASGSTYAVHGKNNQVFPFKRDNVSGYHTWTCPLSEWQKNKFALAKEMLDQPLHVALIVDFEPTLKEVKPTKESKNSNSETEDVTDFRDPKFAMDQLRTYAESLSITEAGGKPIEHAKRSAIVDAIDLHLAEKAENQKKAAEAAALGSNAPDPK